MLYRLQKHTLVTMHRVISRPIRVKKCQEAYTTPFSILNFLPPAQREENVWLGADVLDSGRPRPDLPPEHVVEDLHGVLLALKVDPVHVPQQQCCSKLLQIWF